MDQPVILQIIAGKRLITLIREVPVIIGAPFVSNMQSFTQ